MNFIKFGLVVCGIQHPKVHVAVALFETHKDLRPFNRVLSSIVNSYSWIYPELEFFLIFLLHETTQKCLLYSSSKGKLFSR